MAPLEGQPVSADLPGTRTKRTRLYFGLMDLCLIAAALGLADHIASRLLDWHLQPGDSIIYTAFGSVVLFFNFIVPPFLMIGKFMRDEYAEMLWQRSVAILGYAFAFAPLLLLATLVAVNLTNPAAQADGAFVYLFGDVPADWLLITLWMAFLLTWVGIFQFLRWRDAK
jgi:hypothetical protein